MKVQAESFDVNYHIIGFRPQTQKLESPYKTPSNTLAVKGLMHKFGLDYFFLVSKPSYQSTILDAGITTSGDNDLTSLLLYLIRA